jgi:hypothetical protein
MVETDTQNIYRCDAYGETFASEEELLNHMHRLGFMR